MFAAATAAAVDTDDGNTGTGKRGQQEVSRPTYRVEEGDGTTHAQRIVKELYHRYQKQLQRWRDYRNLFFFLAFVALFLAVLYLQRQANTAYKVHATMQDVLVPADDTMASTDDVYTWLKNVLTNVWVDPKCGDGICESPFEFASYSRFGCRADCGKLQEVQNLTQVQADIYWDFSHPVGSIPSSDLMQQASWNICPVSTPFSNACYYDKDVTFDRLSYTDSRIISDMPDGNWTLLMRRDIFMKTWGAVRDYNKLLASSYYFKVYMSVLSALAEQNTEMTLLAQADTIGRMSLMSFILANLRNVSAVNATDASFQYAQFLNATCACANVPINGTTSTTWLQNGTLLQAFNNSVNGTTDFPTYASSVCTPAFGSGVTPQLWEYVPANVTSTGSIVFGNVTGSNYTTINTIKAVTNQTAFCIKTLTNLTQWQQLMTNTTQQLLIDKRLGDGSTTGKIAARNTVFTALRTFILSSFPELFDPVINVPTGSLALTEMWNARTSVLQDQFVAGVYYATNPMPAYVNISRKVVYVSNVTMISMAERARARINETRFQQVETLGIQVPANPNYPKLAYPAYVTIADLLTAFYQAMGSPAANSTVCQTQGCTPVLMPNGNTTIFLPNATLPSANSSALNTTTWGGAGIKTDYNLVVWRGNNTAYMTCDLPGRGPEYYGTCTNMAVTCVNNNNNDTVPYNCTRLSTGAAVSGSLSVVQYRSDCEFPCDLKQDCDAICDCTYVGGCNATQTCTCKACTDLNKVASADSQFVDVTASATSAGRSTASLADVSGLSTTGRRQLLQSTTDTLNSVLQRVSDVKTQQDAIATSVTSLQAQVNRANTLAEARANDNRLIDLITAGRQDIAAGQARVEAKLDEIIGKQNESLALANAATAALQAIQGLASKQLAAQQALEKAVQSQLSAIKTATYSGVISLTQALSLWKRARRERALTIKAAKLANVPCNSLPSQDNIFLLDNGNSVDNTTSRERNIGLTNRVIQGLLLHQYRTNETNCTDSKFNKIQQTCTGPTTLKSYGVDPTFKLGTTLYNPDLDDAAGTQVLPYYNCSLLANPTYNITFQNMTTNQAPYCAELYNSQKLPYAFHHFPMAEKEPGFPVLLDINLDSDGAQTWETYLEEGLYLDQHTRSLTAELITYNAPLRIFGYFYIQFFFSDGGSIKITNRLSTVRVELYNSYEDDVRFAFEIILSIWIYGMMLYTIFQIIMTQKEKGNFLKWFESGWNWVDFISNGLLTACMCIWWVFVTRYAKTYDVALRYNVYTDLQPTANYLALNEQGSQLTGVVDDVNETKALIDLLNWYFALNGINILLLIARVLRLMDFQPRLGVVTRSLWLAGPDLIHFAIVAGMVFVGYAMMAHLIFGNAIEQFQTFGDSVNTCFEILLGNIDVNKDLRDLGGLQSVAGALFFWSYELLVFMVLLNFLLAIIVDAFSEVKEKTHETVGIHTELYQLMRDKWRSLMGSFSSNYISDDKLGSLLKQWAGDDQPTEKADMQAEVQKLLTILNEDLDEEDLRSVLMECLKDAPQQDEAQKEPQRTGLARFLPRRKKVTASPHEVSQAAKYIIDRFGVPVEAEEGEQEAEGEEGGHTTHQVVGAEHSGALVAAGPNIDKERDQLANALERLAEVQRELADGQRNLMNGQKQLAEQQAKLVGLMNLDGSSAQP